LKEFLAFISTTTTTDAAADTTPHLVHFLPPSPRLFLDELEEGRGGEKVVLDHMEPLNKVEYLSLCPSTAVDHTMDIGPMLIQHPLDDRGIGTGW